MFCNVKIVENGDILHFHAESKVPNASSVMNHINLTIITNLVSIAKPTIN